MRFFRPASRALSHLLRHDPVHHYSSPASLFSRHSPFAPFSRAFDDPFFSSPFTSPLYTLYEVTEDDNNNNTTNSSKTEQSKNKLEESKAAESQQQQEQQQQQQPRSNGNQLTRQDDSHRQRWLDRRSNRRHRHHHNHQPLSLFSPFDSLLASSPFFSPSTYQPLEISVDLYSTPSAYQVNAAIPGVRKEDIKLTVEDGVLTIEAERREERGRPAKTTPASSASTASTASNSATSTTSTATSTDATAETPQAEQKTVEVEVKADGGVETKRAADTNAQQPQQQVQQQQEHEEEEEEDDVSVHHVESYYGRVQRSLALPEDVNVEGLTARYEDGVLKIELPRIEEKKQQVKQINIQ